MTMTDEEYVKLRGVRCPFCKSDQIEGEHIEVDAGGAFQDVSCLGCDRTWTDYYILVGCDGH
jgi:transposase-like protein